MKLRMLSPVHIGSGRELTVVDFLPLNDRTIAVLDLERLFEKLMEINADLDEILEVMRKPETLPDEYVWRHVLGQYNIDPGEVRKYSLPVVGEPGKRSMRIREFIKVRGKPYIPGSSVKGAIRTAVFYKIAGEHPDKLAEFLNGLLRGRVSKTRADDRLEAEVFGYNIGRKGEKVYEPKRDPMRALVVRDSRPFGLKHLRMYSVSIVDGERSIPQYVEGAEGVEIELEVKIDRDLIDRGLKERKLNGLLAEVLSSGREFEELIWEAVEDFADKVISFELESIERYGRFSTEVEMFYRELRGLDGHKLRIGWGGGWYSMTLGPLLLNHPAFQEIRKKLGLGKPYQSFPRTRRVANSKPMAWVLLGE